MLLIKERTEIRPFSSKDFEEEIVWRAFTEFDRPGKSSGPNGIRHLHWVKLYDETNGQNNLRAEYTKSFLLHIHFTFQIKKIKNQETKTTAKMICFDFFI